MEERRLLIYIFTASHSYTRYEVIRVSYIQGVGNCADGLNMIKDNGILRKMFESGIMNRKAERQISFSNVDAPVNEEEREHETSALQWSDLKELWL